MYPVCTEQNVNACDLIFGITPHVAALTPKISSDLPTFPASC
jgi:hypothetical protein